MDLIKKTVEQVTKDSFLILAIASTIFCLFPQRERLLMGLVFGTIVAILNLNLLKLTVRRFPREKKPVFFLRRQLFQRLLIYGVAFTVAVSKNNISEMTVVLGFFLPKIAIYWGAWGKNNVLALKAKVIKE